MRLLKFIAAFVVSAMLVYAFVFGLNWKSFTTFIDNRDAMAEGSEWVEKTYSLRGLSEYIDENPGNVSIASVVLGEPDSTILYQPEVRRSMGTTANLFILLAYAREFEAGNIDREERFLWSDVSRYQLPEVEASRHRNTHNLANSRGLLEEGTISYEDALKLMAEMNDLALADYLWWQLDPTIWTEITEEYSLHETDMPLPYSGLYLAISTAIQEQTFEEIVNAREELSDLEWRDLVREQSRLFAEDEEERSRIISILNSDRIGNSFMEERDAMLLFPMTTVTDIISLLEKVWNEEQIGSEAANDVKTWMRWPFNRESEVRRHFEDYGALYDNRMGLLNGVDFGTSTYTGDTTVQAIFFDRLPVAFWFHMSSNHMHQDFQQRLIYDPAMIDRMKVVSSRHHNQPAEDLSQN
ncbi:MAG: hypothetical protein JJU46_11340 [Balneolaceae bacterium]|nr:hypothetical protein [Balneolaceae bacterium]MCH8549222.1 hypothetical protein [Balneolaceae bacterium]